MVTWTETEDSGRKAWLPTLPSSFPMQPEIPELLDKEGAKGKDGEQIHSPQGFTRGPTCWSTGVGARAGRRRDEEMNL